MTREDAIKVLRTESVEIGGNAVSVARWLAALDVAVKALEDVPVVRCRECKYGSGCPIIDANIWMDDDDFCSHGERKEGADNG